MASSTSPAKLTAKGERTRQRILESASTLIFEHGVAKTTVEDVRSAARVSSSQLYHYFCDKDALVRAVIQFQSDSIVAGQEPRAFDSIDGLERWRDGVVATVRAHRARGGCPLGSLGGELAEIDGAAREEVSASFRRWEAALREGFRAMRARGDLGGSSDPDGLALATLAALQGGLLLSKVHRSVGPVESALDAMIALVRRS